MNSSEEEQIYSIALTMVPGIGHIGAKHLIDGMGNAVDVFRLRKEMPERIPEVSQRVIEALDCPQAVFRAEQEYEFIRKNRITPVKMLRLAKWEKEKLFNVPVALQR